MVDGMSVEVRDNPAAKRYELLVDGEVRGRIDYAVETGTLTLVHTEVDADLEGRGLGSRLVHEALEDIRERNLRLVPICPFIRSYLRRHPEYADLVA
jgi:uncharacterized protein